MICEKEFEETTDEMDMDMYLLGDARPKDIIFFNAVLPTRFEIH